MSGNSGPPDRGPPPTTTTPYTSGSPYYTADNRNSSSSSFYPMGGQPPYEYGAVPYGSELGQQPAYASMSSTAYQLASTGAAGSALPPMSTFDQSAQYPFNSYGPPPANRGPPPPHQAGMSMPSNTPSYTGQGYNSTGTGQTPVLRPNRGGSPIRRRRQSKQSSSKGLASIAAGSGGGQAPASVVAPPNPIHGFGPPIPAGLAAPPPQAYPQGGYSQVFGPQQSGNQYLGPRSLGQFHLSTSLSQVGSPNDLGQSGAEPEVPRTKTKIKRWNWIDNERLKHMRNVERKTFDQIGEALGCTGSEASTQHQKLQRQSDAIEEARGRVSKLANSSNPVPVVKTKGNGVKWTIADATWMEQRLNTLTRAPENRHKQPHEVLDMVAAEINFKNGTTVSRSTVEGTLSKLSAERSGRRMEWG